MYDDKYEILFIQQNYMLSCLHFHDNEFKKIN